MNSLYYLCRLSNKLPYILNRVFFHVLFIIKPVKKYCDLNPQLYLNSIYPDNGESSLCDCNVVKKNPKYDVQIIVPVYKVEKYLKECLDSILNQKTRYKFCIVAVNDGSPDNSRKILEEYEKYPNVKIIDQENKGLSGARNSALKEIDAKYVMFLDSDDILCDGAIEQMVKCAKQTGVDIVQGHYLCFLNDGRVMNGRNMKKGFCSPQDLPGYVWGKLYKADLWENFCFPEKYLFEDSINRLVLFNIVPKAYVLDVNVLMYRQNIAGICSTSVGNKKVVDSIWITKKLVEDYKKLNKPVTGDVCAAFLKQFMYNYTRILSLNDEKINYAVFLIYRKLMKSINIDMSSYGYRIRMAYNSLIANDYKRFLFCSIFLR